MNKTKIEWCDATVNPVVGCTFGCPYCYARRMCQRFGFVEDFEKPQFFENRLDALHHKNGKIIFMDSMSDVADWEEVWFAKTMRTIRSNPQHRYLFLTKRPEILQEKGFFNASENTVWYGVSVNNQQDLHRADELPVGENAHCFVSIEPLHENLKLSEMSDDKKREIWDKIDWLIIGAETGNRNGKIKPQETWVKDIVRFSKECFRVTGKEIPIFMKESLVPTVGEENMLRQFPKGLCDL